MPTTDLDYSSRASAPCPFGTPQRPLASWGALGALAALPLIILNASMGAADPTSGRFLVGRIAGLAGTCCLLIAAVGFLARGDVLGKVGGAGAALAATVGTALGVGLRWADAFVVPYLAHLAPQALARATGALGDGIVISNSGFALGWLLVGLAAWRARQLPRWLSGLLVATSLLSFMPTHLDPGHVKHLPTLYDEPVPLAVVLALVGGVMLWRQRGMARSSVGAADR